MVVKWWTAGRFWVDSRLENINEIWCCVVNSFLLLHGALLALTLAIEIMWLWSVAELVMMMMMIVCVPRMWPFFTVTAWGCTPTCPNMARGWTEESRSSVTSRLTWPCRRGSSLPCCSQTSQALASLTGRSGDRCGRGTSTQRWPTADCPRNWYDL